MTTAPVKSRHNALPHPPGPLGSWPKGVIKQFQEDPLRPMMEMFHEYGDAIRFRAVFNFYGYLFFHPEILIRTSASCWPASPTKRPHQALTYWYRLAHPVRKKPMLIYGLLTVDVLMELLLRARAGETVELSCFLKSNFLLS